MNSCQKIWLDYRTIHLSGKLLSFFFNKDDFGLVVFFGLVPGVRNVLGVGEVHPHIAEGGGEGGIEEVVPRHPRSLQEEHPRQDAEVVEDLVPVAQPDVTRSPTVTVHSILQDEGRQTVVPNHWTVIVALRDDVNDH